MKIYNCHYPNTNIHFSKKASVLYNDKSVSNPITLEKTMTKTAQNFVKRLCENNEKVRIRQIQPSTSREPFVRLESGEPIEGFIELHNFTKKYTCYFDKRANLESCYKLDKNLGCIDIIEGDKNISYSRDEVQSLRYYKNNSVQFHAKLRKNKTVFRNNFLEELNAAIKHIENIFNTPGRTLETKKDMVLYRALPSLSDDELMELCRIGGIYEDKSFCSTSKSLEVAKQFNNKSFIIKINVPKGTKYIDMDRLQNIDSTHWREQEMLLNKNSKFRVKAFLDEGNLVEVDLLKQ